MPSRFVTKNTVITKKATRVTGTPGKMPCKYCAKLMAYMAREILEQKKTTI